MLVVADSSPVNVLVRIGHVDVLPELFQQVAIPLEVARELSQPRTPQEVRDWINKPPTWLTVRAPAQIEPIARLDPGERAAISLAQELGADFLLIDEKAGRRAAVERRLAIIGTIGILERAADQGLLNLKDAFARVRQTEFFVSDDLIAAALARQRKPTAL
jgi:predicted nucleic acid-binding protein